MRKLVLTVITIAAMVAIAAPSASAQEKDAHMKGEMAESHWMKGTMTPPEGEAMDIKYELKKGEDGMKGWIVGDDDGEEVRIAMKDLKWEGDYMTYNWSPPDEAGLVISCKLMKQDDGGFAGDCTDNQDESRTGQMTVAPMKKKEMKPADG